MLQFKNTDLEIAYLLADNRVSAAQKAHLALIQGQSYNAEHLEERNRVLDEINDQLAEYALEHSTSLKLNAAYSGISRVSPRLMQFVRDHKSSLQEIDLSGNNLVMIPEFNLIRVNIHFEKNPFSNPPLAQPPIVHQFRTGTKVGVELRTGINYEQHTVEKERSCTLL